MRKKMMVGNYELLEASEDKKVFKERLTCFYYDLDMSFIRFLENQDLFQQVLDYAYCLCSLDLLPDGVSYDDISDCVCYETI